MGTVRTAKEIVRHALHVCGWRRDMPHLRQRTRQERFAEIYASGFWKHGAKETPASGTGSSLQATAELREELPALVRRLEVTSVLDVGCGDFTWMQYVDLGCPYIGVDIVPSVIDQNTRLYGSDHRTFLTCDAVADDLPAADLVLCREVLFHLSLDDCMATLRHIVSTKSPYFMATTDRGTGFNADILSGDYRLLNLEIAPFNLPKPTFEFEESGDGLAPLGRVLGLWMLEDLKFRN